VFGAKEYDMQIRRGEHLTKIRGKDAIMKEMKEQGADSTETHPRDRIHRYLVRGRSEADTSL
jgi:hypothetical protein